MNDLKAIHKTVIVVMFLGTIGVLQGLGKQTESFITVGLLLLAGMGFAIGKIESVQKQTNGGQQQLIAVIQENNSRQSEILRLVASLPPAPAAIEGTTTTTTTFEGVDRDQESMAQSR